MMEYSNDSKKVLALFEQAHKAMLDEFNKRYDCEISKLNVFFHPLKARFNIKRYDKILCEFFLVYLENDNKYLFNLKFADGLSNKVDLDTVNKIKAFVRFRLKFISILK